MFCVKHSVDDITDGNYPFSSLLDINEDFSEDNGDELDYDRLRDGRDFWRTSRRENTHGPSTITIVVNVGAGCRVKHEDILWRGAAAIALATRLEEAGYRVEIWAGWRSVRLRSTRPNPTRKSHYDVAGVAAICLKRPDDPLGADADTTDGLDISGAIVDEIHAHKSRELWDVLETGTGARTQPLIFGITTAGRDDGGESICWEHHQHTTSILEGLYDDDSWFGMVFTLDKGDDWADETVWAKPNPNLDVSVSLEDLRRKCKKAEKNPGAQLTFRQKHMNLFDRRGWIRRDSCC